MTIPEVHQTIEKSITTPEEHAYFNTHSVRYYQTLTYITDIAKEKKYTILDIGCFPYHMGRALELLGHTVYGIASSHEPIDNKNIFVVNIESESLPFKENFFDMVLFNEVIEHLPHSPVFPLKEIYRVTKKNGYCMVTTPNIARSINRATLLLGKSIMYPIDVYFENKGKGNTIYHRHNREYILSELQTLFMKTGWKIESKGYFISYTPFRKRTIPDPWWLFAGKYINYLLMRICPSLQDNLYVIGKK